MFKPIDELRPLIAKWGMLFLAITLLASSCGAATGAEPSAEPLGFVADHETGAEASAEPLGFVADFGGEQAAASSSTTTCDTGNRWGDCDYVECVDGLWTITLALNNPEDFGPYDLHVDGNFVGGPFLGKEPMTFQVATPPTFHKVEWHWADPSHASGFLDLAFDECAGPDCLAENTSDFQYEVPVGLIAMDGGVHNGAWLDVDPDPLQQTGGWFYNPSAPNLDIGNGDFWARFRVEVPDLGSHVIFDSRDKVMGSTTGGFIIEILSGHVQYRSATYKSAGNLPRWNITNNSRKDIVPDNGTYDFFVTVIRADGRLRVQLDATTIRLANLGTPWDIAEPSTIDPPDGDYTLGAPLIDYQNASNFEGFKLDGRITKAQLCPGPFCSSRFVTIIASSTSVTGTPGNDVIVGTDGNDQIDAGEGNDVICSGAGIDTIDGGPGNDVCWTGPGADTAINCTHK